MNRAEQLKQKYKNAHLLQQFSQGQTEPSTKSLKVCQLPREQVREDLLLLQSDVEKEKQQQQSQILADASEKEAAKDKVGISREEKARMEAPKAGTGLTEDVAPDQCTDAVKKVLASEKSAATLCDLHMLNRERADEKHNVCHHITRATSATTVLPNAEELTRQRKQLKEAEKEVELRKQLQAER